MQIRINLQNYYNKWFLSFQDLERGMGMNKICILDTELQIKEWNGQRVVTLSDIDKVHGRTTGTSRRNFNTNKKHLIDGEDYIVRNSYEAKQEYGITAPNGLTLLTESGYLLLVKSFTDDLAWEVQRQLVNSYFKLKEVTETVVPTGNYVMMTNDRYENMLETVTSCAAIFQNMIDYATINYKQQNDLLTCAKERVLFLLGGAHSEEYKKHSRTYFKNLWIQFCMAFDCDSYKNLNPIYMADDVAKHWILEWTYEK